MDEAAKRNILVTGAAGLVGRKVLQQIGADPVSFGDVVALDVVSVPADAQNSGVIYITGDICDPTLVETLKAYDIDVVVHLAAIMAPGKDSSRDLEYKVDVLGTKNILEACIATGVDQYIGLSSGAAYGYHRSNPVPLRESDALLGNEAFAYSWHKRLVEEMCADYRVAHPQLKQLIFRPGTILGDDVKSPVSALFEKSVVMGIAGADSPFVLIWDEDVAAAIVKGIKEGRAGEYNLTCDGALSLREIARIVGKPYVPMPAFLLQGLLWVLKKAGLSQRGPEGVDFLRYRPVLANDKLKDEFGYVPEMTSREVFDRYQAAQEGRG